MESDPEVLVALAAVGIQKIIPTQSSSTVHHLPLLMTSTDGAMQSILPTEHTMSSVYTIIGDYDINCIVLDAFAGVSVSHPSNSVVAVALEMDIANHVVVLTIPGSDDYGPDLIAHLNGLWRLMCIMSTRCEKFCQSARFTAQMHSQSRIPIIEGVEQWRTEFIRRIYLYTISVYEARKREHWNGFNSFASRLVGSWGDPTEHQEMFLRVIYSLQATFSIIDKTLSGCDISDQEWGDLICLMDCTVIEIEDLLETTLCEEWVIKYQSPNNPLYPLRSTIQTLIAEHRHIHTLLRFAYSPRSRPILLCKLTVRVIPEHPGIPNSPHTSALRWQSVIESVCGDNLITRYSWLHEQAKQLCGRRTRKVHAVCALIAFLEMPPRGARPPFSYIGVSTPICNACYAWIQANNSVGGRQYRTRSTNGQWCPVWAMPRLVLATELQKELSAHMARFVVAHYVRFWVAQGELYSAGEIPDGIRNGPTSTPAPHAATRRQELLKRQKVRNRNYGW